ncbi:MAG: 2-oxoacid:acceptor oxidoreductase family protein [Thermoplasmata archaeon]|nr:2-oxoacid:acceptor oxidoreductase family protein [Thermoplasmata archaeon]
MRLDVRIAGVGGQGALRLGMILAEAAMRDGFEVLYTQKYTSVVRLQASSSAVIISDSRIKFPVHEKIDLLIAMHQKGYDEWYHLLRGVAVVEPELVKDLRGVREAYGVPAREISVEVMGSAIATNTAMLGAASHFLPLKISTIEETLRDTLGEKNVLVFRRGREKIFKIRV